MREERSLLFPWNFRRIFFTLYTLRGCVLFDKLNDILQELSQMQLWLKDQVFVRSFRRSFHKAWSILCFCFFFFFVHKEFVSDKAKSDEGLELLFFPVDNLFVQTVNVDFIWCCFFGSSHKSRDFDRRISIIVLKSIILSVLDAVIRRSSSKQANSVIPGELLTLNLLKLPKRRNVKSFIIHSTTIIIKPAIIASFGIFLQWLLDSWDFKSFGNNVKFP